MGSIVTNGDYFSITICPTEEVVRQTKELIDCHNNNIDFIIASAKQMVAFLQSCNSDTDILRTPRRTSKRKQSSISSCAKTSSKKGQTLCHKVRDVTTATPRRFSKRSKRLTIEINDTTVEQIEATETLTQMMTTTTTTTVTTNTTVVNNQINHIINEENINGLNCVEAMDVVINDKIDPIIVDQDVDINEVLVIDNIVMTASELMSELSIKEDEQQIDIKAVESDEWMTDDEDCPKEKKGEEFYDAIEPKEMIAKQLKNTSVNNSMANKTVTNSANKDKHKKSLYFTPQMTQRSTRAQTRMLSRIVDSSQKTPQTSSRVVRLKESNRNSDESSSSRVVGTSSNRSVRSYSRIQKKTDIKAMTDSAMKRRQEAEHQRRQRLLASEEKEKRANEKRRILLEQTVNQRKITNEEKAKRAAELRERQKQIETERIKRELQRKEELEKRQHLNRIEQMNKKIEEKTKKTFETERKKQFKEMQEIEAQIKKEDELRKKQEQERERLREQERMASIIQHHNSSLQQKAIANSFIKKQDSNPILVPKVVVNKMSPIEIAQHMNATYSKDTEKETTDKVVETDEEVNKTYLKGDSKQHSSYDMTPPPKERDFDNYDISQIQSDDDTDDEQQPRKRIPEWARGHSFVNQLHNQFNKSQGAVFKDAKIVFGTRMKLLERFQTEFELIFPEKPLHPRYAKRTSSAVWEEAPSRYHLDDSSINQSYI